MFTVLILLCYNVLSEVFTLNKKIVILIPAYNPTSELIDLIKELKHNLYSHIVVVNDGSSLIYTNIFNTISNDCIIINHDKNCGKGIALKTGFNYILKNFHNISTIITVDADGQHLVKDINKLKTTANTLPNNLILGSRDFKKANIPFRNKFGNICMSLFFSFFYKIKIPDTQTGLRAIPLSFIDKLIYIKGNRYEYEQNILNYFTRHFRNNISFVKINAVYKKNQISHFKIFKDSSYIVKCLFQKND